MFIPIFFIVNPDFAQSSISSSLSELTVGQKCPGFELKNIINYSQSSVKLSDFRGKLLIIDFWATWCTACIENLPKLDSLQKKYEGKIAIMPVTYEKTEAVKNVINKNKIWKSINLPTATEDSVLHMYFRHSSVPHEVWIDGNGIIRAITSYDQVTEKNIRLLLNGDCNTLPVKKDILDWNLSKPLLLGSLGSKYNLDKNKIRYSSVLTEYIEGMPGVIGLPIISDSIIRMTGINISIDAIYRMVIATKAAPYVLEKNPDFYLTFPSRTIWESKKTDLCYWAKRDKDAWIKTPANKKYFCYELIMPIRDSLKFNSYALKYLNSYFGGLYGIEAVREKRKVQCLSLIRTEDIDNIHSHLGKYRRSIDENADSIVLQNCTISDFLFHWLSFQMESFPIPIIDETNYNKPIDLKIKADPKNVESVRAGLRNYGLDLIKVERELDMIVIKDSTNNNR